MLQIPDDPDLGVHLGVGRYIYEHGAIPRTDIFSFALTGHPYVYHSWLSQLAITAVHDGWGGLSRIGTPLIRLSIVWSVLIALGVWLLYRLSTHSFWLTLSMLLSTSLIFSSIGVRPQVFSFLGSIILLYSLIGWRSKKYALRYVAGLPLLFLVWANMHPGFLMGLLVMGVFIGVDVISNLGILSSLRRILFIFCASVAATLVNPFGFGLYKQIYAISTNPFNTQVNLEWVPLVARGNVHIGFAGICLVLIVILSFQKKKDWALLACAVILYLLMLRSTRTAMIFMVVFLPLIAPLFAKWKGPFLSKHKDWVSAVPLYMALFALGLGIFSRMLTNVERVSAALTDPHVFARRNGYPYRALQALDMLPETARVFNYFNWGGYMVLTRPDRQVFETGINDTAVVDGHLFLVDYFAILNGKSGWHRLIASYGIDTILVPPAADIVTLLKRAPDWTIVYEDEESVLMSRAPIVLQ